jgi:hypothetical protein
VVLDNLCERYLAVHTPKPLPNRQSGQHDRPAGIECWSGRAAGIFARILLSRRSIEPSCNGAAYFVVAFLLAIVLARRREM